MLEVKTIYRCDRCGREMVVPSYTYTLETKPFVLRPPRFQWHYCESCFLKINKVMYEKETNENYIYTKDIYPKKDQ